MYKRQQLTLLDIGGGFPCFNSETDIEREQFFEPINKALLIHFPETRIIAEPGRSVANACVSIVSTVVGKCKKEGKYWYYLDEGLYGSFSGQCFDAVSYTHLDVYKRQCADICDTTKAVSAAPSDSAMTK